MEGFARLISVYDTLNPAKAQKSFLLDISLFSIQNNPRTGNSYKQIFSFCGLSLTRISFARFLTRFLAIFLWHCVYHHDLFSCYRMSTRHHLTPVELLENFLLNDVFLYNNFKRRRENLNEKLRHDLPKKVLNLNHFSFILSFIFPCLFTKEKVIELMEQRDNRITDISI